MRLANIFKWSYWFYQPFIAVGFAKWFWVLSFLFLVLFGLMAKIVRQQKKDATIKEFLRRLGNFALSMGFWGLTWMFFRQERVAFLAWRFWLILWGVVFIYWGYKVIFYYVKRIPQIKEEERRREEIAKYLPGNR